MIPYGVASNSVNQKQEYPTFSVLMSVCQKDDANFFREALCSVSERQTVQPNQIVIVADGPIGDELKSVVNDAIERFGESVAFVQLDKNSGLGIALREGARFCAGDYIIRMDADDLSVPNRIEIQKRYVLEHPDVDAFGGYIEEFDSIPGDLGSFRKVPINESGIRSMLRMRNPMNHVTMCIKRSSLQDVGSYEDVPYCEDYYLWAKMLACGCKLVNMPLKLVDVRVGNGFAARRGAKKQVSSWSVIQRYLLSNKMTTRLQSWIALISIRLFVYMPARMKKMLYGSALRSEKMGK